nr:MAG TPA: hypothetical protein [Caudoviricetes sp.]
MDCRLCTKKDSPVVISLIRGIINVMTTAVFAGVAAPPAAPAACGAG